MRGTALDMLFIATEGHIHSTHLILLMTEHSIDCRATIFHYTLVECLLIGRLLAPTYTERIRSMVKATESKPKLVVEFWPTGANYHEHGPLCKATRVLWEEIRYGSRCQIVRASEVGSSVDHAKLVVVRTIQSGDKFWWPDAQLESVIRPMANCLLPVGVPRNAFRVGSPTGHEPRAQQDLMPERSGQVIIVDGKRRRLLDQELAKGLGVPKSWLKNSTRRCEMLKETTSIHILEYLIPFLETTIYAELRRTTLDHLVIAPSPCLLLLKSGLPSCGFHIFMLWFKESRS